MSPVVFSVSARPYRSHTPVQAAPATPRFSRSRPCSAVCAASFHQERRAVLYGGLAASVSLIATDRADAIQGLTPGRIPGLSKVDADGFRTYKRPEGKSGGHGVGWSEIPQYSFRVPDGFDEIPVSIADLGGTELDLRLKSEDGDVAVIVAPVLRFKDIGFNANIVLEEIISKEALISGFAPELIGQPLDEGDVVSSEVQKRGELTYYNYELKPRHLLVSVTAYKNRIFILTVAAKPVQWRKAEDKLRKIYKTFMVV